MPLTTMRSPGGVLVPVRQSGARQVGAPGGVLLPQGTAAYWPFDDRGGVVVRDASGNGNSGQWQGSLGNQWGQGVGVFNGTDNYVLVPDSPSLRPSRLSIIVRFRETSSPSFACLVSKNFNPPVWVSPFVSYLMRIDGTSLEFSLSLGGSEVFVIATGLTFSGTLHTAVATYDGTAMTIYFDGIQKVTAAHTGVIDYAAQPLTIAADNSSAPRGDYFPGFIDLLAVVNHALSAQEIQTL